MARAQIVGDWIIERGQARWVAQNVVIAQRQPEALWKVWVGGSGLGAVTFGCRMGANDNGLFAELEDAILAAEEYVRTEVESTIAKLEETLAEKRRLYQRLLGGKRE